MANNKTPPKSGPGGSGSTPTDGSKSGAGSTGSSNDSGPRKPTATLDLKATEIKDAGKGSGPDSRQGAGKDPGKGTPPSGQPGAQGSATASGSSSAKTTGAAASSTGADTSAASKAADSKTTASPSGQQTSASPAGPATPPASSSGGFGRLVSTLVGGAVGALLALFGANEIADFSKRQFGVEIARPGAGDTAAIGELSGRIADIEARVLDATNGRAGALPAEIAERLTALEGRIDGATTGSGADVTALVDRIAQLEQRAGAGEGPQVDLAPVEQRIGRLESQLATLASAGESGNGGQIEQLAALTGRIEDFKVELDTRINGLKQAMTEDIEGRVGQLGERMGALDQAETIATLRSGIDRLGGEIETLKAQNDRVSRMIADAEAARSDLKGLIERAGSERTSVLSAIEDLKSATTSELASRVTQDDVGRALEPVNTKLAAVEKTLSGLAEREGQREDASKRILVSLELAELKRAVERGEPIAERVAQIDSLGIEGLDLGALKAQRGARLATLSELEADFRPVGRAIIDTETEPDTGSVLDKLLSGAQSIVRVRRTGEVPGEGAEAIVARMETALGNGDLPAVLREADGLSPAGNAAAAEWLDRVRARQSVNDALAKVESALKAALAPATGN